MAFSRPTLQELIERITNDLLSRVTSGTGMLRRSFLRVYARVVAAAINLTYGFIDYMSKMFFIETAEDEFLERRGDKWGITRDQKKIASGPLIMYGDNGTVIPVGTIWLNDDGGEYKTLTGETIAAGQAQTDVQALKAGLSYNREENDTLTISTPIAGLINEGGVGTGGIVGGADKETDISMRERIKARVQHEAMGGNDSDYKEWMKDTPGVAVNKSWIFGNVLGPATVACYFRVDPWDSPSVPQIALVQANIDVHKPLGATPTALAPTEADISITVTATPNTAPVRTAIKDSLVDFFEKRTDVGETLYLSNLDEAISLATGEVSHTITELKKNGDIVPTDDITMATGELPILDSLTVNGSVMI